MAVMENVSGSRSKGSFLGRMIRRPSFVTAIIVVTVAALLLPPRTWLANAAGSTTSWLVGGNAIGANTQGKLGATDGTVCLEAAGTCDMYLLNSSVGILQPNPGYPLDVNGKAHVSGQLLLGSGTN